MLDGVKMKFILVHIIADYTVKKSYFPNFIVNTVLRGKQYFEPILSLVMKTNLQGTNRHQLCDLHPVAEVWEFCQQQLPTDLSELSAVEIKSYHCPKGIKALGKSRDYFRPFKASVLSLPLSCLYQKAY